MCSKLLEMSLIINGKYVLARISQTELEKASLMKYCKFINRLQFRKLSKNMSKDEVAYFNFLAELNDKGEIDIIKPMYFIG